jgi:hypothetical protein
MSLTDTQISRLTAALDRQLEADKKFEAKTQAIIESLSPSPPPPLAPAQSAEADQQLEAKTKASPDPPPQGPPPPASPPLLPQVFEDRYSKGWSDACDFIRPQQYEFQRRYRLARREIASLGRWVKWLPVICFCCTVLGFALGWWSAVSLPANKTSNTAQKLEMTPKVTVGRGDKHTP